MTTITTASNAFTVEDLESLPADNRRYDLIGGSIVMTPAPEPVHQRVSRRLHVTAFRLTDGSYASYVDTSGPVSVDWPVVVSFDVAALARP